MENDCRWYLKICFHHQVCIIRASAAHKSLRDIDHCMHPKYKPSSSYKISFRVWPEAEAEDILRYVFIKCASSVHLLHITAWEIFWGAVHGTINRGETAENGFLNAHVRTTLPYHTIHVRTSIPHCNVPYQTYVCNHTVIPYCFVPYHNKRNHTSPYHTNCPKMHMSVDPPSETIWFPTTIRLLSHVILQRNVTIWNHEISEQTNKQNWNFMQLCPSYWSSYSVFIRGTCDYLIQTSSLSIVILINI